MAIGILHSLSMAISREHFCLPDVQGDRGRVLYSKENQQIDCNETLLTGQFHVRTDQTRKTDSRPDQVNISTPKLTQPIQNTIPTPSTLDEDRRVGPSPTSVLDTLFDAPVPPPKKSSTAAMIGLVPKSDFLRWGREWMYSTKEVYTEVQIKKQIQQCRTNMMYNFSKTYNNDRRGDINGYEDFVEVVEVEDESGPRTRSTVEDDDNEWP